MKVLITGASGQVGRALAATAPPGFDILALDRDALDVSDRDAVRRVVAAASPHVIVNAAGYTAVDRAESEEERAMAVNGQAVGYLAEAAARQDAKLIQFSTDFVFDGNASRPYDPEHRPAPISAYGRAKRAGEEAAGPEALIVRTAWIYSAHGANFVTTMLRLLSQEKPVRVVADQVGTPTSATSLAKAIWPLLAAGAHGIYHYTDSGIASWYDFATAISEEAVAIGLLKAPCRVIPIATEDYPTPARRPSYSVLDKQKTYALLGSAGPHWRESLRLILQEIRNNG